MWTPVYLFFSEDLRERVLDTQGSNGLPLRRIFATWQHWLDLARGFLGSWLLYHHTFVFDPDLENGLFIEYGVIGVVLAAGVAAQVFYYRRALYCLGPVLYLVGTSFGILDWWIALYGLLAGLFFGGISNSSTAFFFFASGTVAAVGFLFLRIDFEWLLGSGLLLLPVVLAFSAQEGLVMATRRRTPVTE